MNSLHLSQLFGGGRVIFKIHSCHLHTHGLSELYKKTWIWGIYSGEHSRNEIKTGIYISLYIHVKFFRITRNWKKYRVDSHRTQIVDRIRFTQPSTDEQGKSWEDNTVFEILKGNVRNSCLCVCVVDNCILRHCIAARDGREGRKKKAGSEPSVWRSHHPIRDR